MMQWRPDEVRAMAYPEFLASIDGFLQFHGASSKTQPMTRAEFDELRARYPD